MVKTKKNKKTKTKQPKRKEKNFLQRELNPGPLTCKVITLSIVPQHQLLNMRVKLILFNVFAHEILRVDAV